MASNPPPLLYTIGHSTRPIEAFIALLETHGVRQVVDIRTVPKSRRNPQYGNDALAGALRQAGLEYRHLAALGGLRRARPDSPNQGWRNQSFRGYADYMLTDAFREGLDDLIALARDRCTAIMCAEAVPWRCHRSLVADALLARGHAVHHILDGRAQPHRLTSFAVANDGQVTYPFALTPHNDSGEQS